MIPKRSASYRGSDVAAISMAQHMIPKWRGHVEFRFAQLKKSWIRGSWRSDFPGPRFRGFSRFFATHSMKSAERSPMMFAWSAPGIIGRPGGSIPLPLNRFSFGASADKTFIPEASHRPPVVITADRLARLRQFGLTEYQARVYLALLDLGTATATQIPPHSGVPRTRIYGAMAQLHERGLVEILPEDPLRYKPVPFNAFLAKRAADFRDRARHLEEETPTLAREFAVRAELHPQSRGRFEAIRGRRKDRKSVVKMYSAAR